MKFLYVIGWFLICIFLLWATAFMFDRQRKRGAAPDWQYYFLGSVTLFAWAVGLMLIDAVIK